MTTTIKLSNTVTGEIWERIVPVGHLVSFDLMQLVIDVINWDDFSEAIYDELTDWAFTVGITLDKVSPEKADKFGCEISAADKRHYYHSYKMEAERA